VPAGGGLMIVLMIAFTIALTIVDLRHVIAAI